MTPGSPREETPWATPSSGAWGSFSYFVHGVNRKTTAALLGTLLSVLFTLLLARFLAEALGFTGLSGEETLLLKQRGGVDLLSLWLAGVVVGTLGALTDAAVTPTPTPVSAFGSSTGGPCGWGMTTLGVW